jgi:dTDP-4-dehydrorhamnose reductase
MDVSTQRQKLPTQAHTSGDMVFNADTRIYLAGCGGMLGAAVYDLFHSTATVMATDIDVNEPWLAYGDVRNYDAINASVVGFRPDVIINLAALTDLEFCEREPDNAWRTNALGAENLGLIASRLDVPYVYISTAGIFGGEKETYNDYDVPNPLCTYAQAKYAGELFTKQYVRRHFVVRAGWMMGGGPQKDKKFILKIYRQLAAGRRVLHVVDDKLGTPTYTVDFARGIKRLLESELYGVYNQVCRGKASRYDVAVELLNCLGLGGKVEVIRVSSEFYAKEYFAKRPANESLVNLKLDARGLNVMRDWRECLRDYVRELPLLSLP